MPYRYNNYSLVADTSFNPFQSMQEMLVPFTLYKEAVDKRNAELKEYSKGLSDFAFLEARLKDNPNSQAAQLYKNFKDKFDAYSGDFSRHGLRRGDAKAWTDLFRSYNPVIGQLKKAEQMRETIFNKRLNEKDNTMIYANDNLDIDDFMGEGSPNLYSISGNVLYTKGAALAKSITDRNVRSGDAGSVLGGYYRNWKETKGVRNADIREFINDPLVQEELDKVMRAEGLNNLPEEKRRRAENYLMSGFTAGITYEENNQLHRDLEKLTKAEELSNQHADRSMKLSAQKEGLKYDKETDSYVFDEDRAQQIMDFYKKNPIEGYEIVPDSNGMPTYKKKTTKAEAKPTETRTNLREARVIFDDGTERPYASSTDGKNNYDEISLGEALSDSRFAEKVNNYDPGWQECYRYYIVKNNGKEALLIAPDKTLLEEKNKKIKKNSEEQDPAVETVETNDGNHQDF